MYLLFFMWFVFKTQSLNIKLNNINGNHSFNNNNVDNNNNNNNTNNNNESYSSNNNNNNNNNDMNRSSGSPLTQHEVFEQVDEDPLRNDDTLNRSTSNISDDLNALNMIVSQFDRLSGQW